MTVRRIVQGLGALLVVAALAFGVPALLIVLAGNPLAGGIEGLLHALGAPDLDGSFLMGTIVPLAAWVAWSYLMFCFVLEAVALARRGAATHPGPTRSPVRRLASTLLTAIALLIAGAGALAPAHAAPPSSVSAAAEGLASAHRHVELAASMDNDAGVSAAGAVDSDARPSTPVITVLEGDSLWNVAERTLGDGARYPEIVALNAGITQADGGALDDDLWLAPGWQLVLPDDAMVTVDVAGASDDDPAEPHAGTVVVEPGDTLWGLAEAHLGDGERFDELAAASGLADASSIRAGDVVVLPDDATGGDGGTQGDGDASSSGNPAEPVEAAPHDTSVAPPGDTPPAVPANPVDGSAAADATASPQPTQPSLPTAAPSADDAFAAPGAPAAHAADPSGAEGGQGGAGETTAAAPEADASGVHLQTVGGIGGGIAAAVLGWLALRRAVQRRQRRFGTRIAMPEGAAEAFERELRAIDGSSSTDALDHATRSLAAWAQDSGNAMPAFSVARVLDHELTLYLDAAAHLPAPFEPIGDDEDAWCVRPEALGPLERVPSPPAPSLVSIGTDASDALVFLDLERVGALGVDGDADLAAQALAALALELTTTDWATGTRVTLVGFDGDPGLPFGAGQVRHVTDLDLLVSELEARSDQVRTELDEVAATSPAHARTLGPDAEAWDIEVVIVATEVEPALAERLVRLACDQPSRGLACVLRGASCAPWLLELASSSTAHLRLPGEASITIDPQLVAPSELRRLVELAHTTSAPATSASIATEDTDWTLSLEPRDTAPLRVDLGVEADVDADADADPDPGADVAVHADAERAAGPAQAAPRRIATAEAPLDEQARELIRSLTQRPWVRLLGPVALQNAAGAPPVTPQTNEVNNSAVNRATELVAYLTLHPGASAEQFHAAFWPGRDPRGKTAASNRNGLTTRTRKWLGTAPDGTPYFPHVGAHGYRLHDDVVTDWHIFLELVGDSFVAAPTARLRAALDLVRGQPFAGVKERFYGWAEVTRMDMLATIGDTCHELATRSLHRGDAAGARTCAALGREIDPINEIAWRDALQAELLAGDRDGFERVVAQLERNLDAFEDGYEPEPETQELIEFGRAAEAPVSYAGAATQRGEAVLA